VRAPQQHARYIERRGALLRQSLHVIEDQLRTEGITVTFPILLAEAVFAGNCLTFVGGVTPYQVVYGRQPAILPPMSIDTENEDPDREGIPNDRIEVRVREIALQTMVEATSQARINRALRIRTVIPGEELFELGDEVEYHRPSTSKDVSGWHGPATVIGIFAEQGQALIKHRDQEMRCRFQDLRQFIGLGMLLPELQFGSVQEAFEEVRTHIEGSDARFYTCCQYGKRKGHTP